MDGQAFDTLVRATSEAASRRGAVVLLLGGVATAALARIEPALGRKKGKGKGKKRRKKCRKLNQGCGGKNKTCCKGLACADGTCLTSSACIEDSVQTAIDAAAPGATLNLCAGTFRGTIVINKNLTLIGAGDGAGLGNTILDGAGAGTVVTIEAGSTVTLQNLRLTGGDTASGGGISNSGTLALTGCTVIGNTADGGFGGGIFNDGTVTLTDCAVIGNTADNGGGGGIRNRGGTMELINSSVSGNTAADGGGILNFGTLELIDSSVTANAAGSSGGGIDNSGTVICSGSSTVRDNTVGDPPVRDNCINADGGTGCATCPG